MEKNPVLLNKTLVIGILILFIGMSVVSSMGYTNMKTNFSVINTKMDSPTILLDENFSGTFPPEGWETGFFGQNNSTCCDSEPPCARGEYTDPYYDNIMKSKAIEASNYEKCIIKFYFSAHPPYGSYSNVYLKYRRNETSSWIDITPWTNPIDDVCEYFETEITYDPEGCGEALQIMWQFIGYYNYFVPNTCIDDVKILGIPINNPPNAPTIDGPISGYPNTEYEFTFVSTDPEEDAVMYNIDWGDGDTEWTEYGDSGVEIILKHTWETSGKYAIKAQAIDIHDAESNWSNFTITMPRNKSIRSSPFLNWLQSHPNMFPLLQKLIQQQWFGQ